MSERSSGQEEARPRRSNSNSYSRGSRIHGQFLQFWVLFAPHGRDTQARKLPEAKVLQYLMTYLSTLGPKLPVLGAEKRGPTNHIFSISLGLWCGGRHYGHVSLRVLRVAAMFHAYFLRYGVGIFFVTAVNSSNSACRIDIQDSAVQARKAHMEKKRFRHKLFLISTVQQRSTPGEFHTHSQFQD